MRKKFDPKKHYADRKARERLAQLHHKNKQKDIAFLLGRIDAVLKSATADGNRAYHSGEISDLGEARHRLFRVSAGTSPQRRWR